MLHSYPHDMTTDIKQILGVHHQLWNGSDTVAYKNQLAPVHVASHGGYRSSVLANAKGIPHLWITQNMNKSTYGSYAITRAQQAGERLRITWIVHTANGEYRYVGQIQTHEYFQSEKVDRIHIETYTGDDVHVVYTTNPGYERAYHE